MNHDIRARVSIRMLMHPVLYDYPHGSRNHLTFDLQRGPETIRAQRGLFETPISKG